MALTVTAGAVGTPVNTGAPLANYPAPGGGILSTDALVLFVNIHKATQAGTESCSTPADWTALVNLEGGANVAAAADVGLCRIYTFWRLAAGGETGTLGLTIANNTGGVSGTHSAASRMFAVRADSLVIDSVAGATANDSAGGAAFSEAFSSNPGITAGDVLLLGFAGPTDTQPGSGLPGTLAATGATLAALADGAVATNTIGLDGSGYTATCLCTAGTASANATWSATLGATNTNWAGPAALIRVREGAAATDPPAVVMATRVPR